MISATDIKYFVEIADTGNISRAAERLGVSQPSLSLAMQRMEEKVGTQLIQRSRKGVRLTQAGLKLRSHSHKMIELWDDIKSEALASVNEARGVFTLGAHPSVAQNILPTILPDLMEKHSDLTFSLDHAPSRLITEKVISFKNDIGFVVKPVPHPDLIIHDLYQGEITLWRSKQKTSANTPEDGTAVLIADPDLIRTQMILKQTEEQGIKFNRIIRTSNIDVIATLTAKGGGIGILPTKDADRYVRNLVRIENAPVYRDTHSMIYRAENKNVQAIKVIKEKALSVFKTP